MLYRPWYSLYAIAAALLAGTLLGQESYLGGGILAAIAFGIIAARRRVEKRGEDDTYTLS